MNTQHSNNLILIMGVSGCGKSTVGAALAAALACPFIEADDYHSPQALEKMRTGHPLDDTDRWPWLARIAAAANQALQSNEKAVIACSALKKAYRTKLKELTDHPMTIIHLTADQQHIAQRMSARSGHFMPQSLLQSQFATLETPDPSENALTIDATLSVNEAVHQILTAIS